MTCAVNMKMISSTSTTSTSGTMLISESALLPPRNLRPNRPLPLPFDPPTENAMSEAPAADGLAPLPYGRGSVCRPLA